MRFLAFFLALLPVAATYAQPIPLPTLSARAWILMDLRHGPGVGRTGGRYANGTGFADPK